MGTSKQLGIRSTRMMTRSCMNSTPLLVLGLHLHVPETSRMTGNVKK